MPVIISGIPIYLVRAANEIAKAEINNDKIFLFSIYISEKRRYINIKQIKRASVIALIESSTNTKEKSTEIVPRNAVAGDDFRCFLNNNPDV